MTTKNVWIVLALVSTAACGGGGSAGPTTQPLNNTPPPQGGISVTNNAFTPASKTVTVGTTVQWAWNSCTGDSYTGQTCVPHNVVFDDGTTSGQQEQGTYIRTFTAAATYNYHCAIHGTPTTGMRGTVTVTP